MTRAASRSTTQFTSRDFAVYPSSVGNHLSVWSKPQAPRSSTISHAELPDLRSLSSTGSASVCPTSDLLACRDCIQAKEAAAIVSGNSSHRPACCDAESVLHHSSYEDDPTYRLPARRRPPFVSISLLMLAHLAEPRLETEMAKDRHVILVMPA